jgi:hypothetical protein
VLSHRDMLKKVLCLAEVELMALRSKLGTARKALQDTEKISSALRRIKSPRYKM